MTKEERKRLVGDHQAMNAGTDVRVGVSVKLVVENKRFDQMAAVVLREEDDRLVVLAEIGVPVRVKKASVLPSARFKSGFPTPNEVDIIHSTRVQAALANAGLLSLEIVPRDSRFCEPRQQCHSNVAMYVADHPSTKQVYGYSLLPGKCGCVTVEAHSVVEDASGRVFDITCDPENLRAKFFVRDPTITHPALLSCSGIPTIELQPGKYTIPAVTPFLHGGLPVLHCGGCSSTLTYDVPLIHRSRAVEILRAHGK